MVERVESHYENIMGPKIYSDDDAGSFWDALKFFSIIFLVGVFITIVLSAEIIKGDLGYLLIIYTMIIALEGICVVVLAYYMSLWNVTRSNPVVHENGLLVPPETVGESLNRIWKPYMASKIAGIYPEFVLRERRSDRENYLEFQRCLVRFMDNRECAIRTSWNGEFIKALNRMLKGKLVDHVKSSNEYFNFNSYNSEKIDELFDRSGPLLRHWKNPIYNAVTLIIVLAGFIMVIIVPAVLTTIFPGYDAFFIFLMIPIMIICFGIPYFHFVSEIVTATEKIIILLHLIEFDETNNAGLIPRKYHEEVELVKSKMGMVRRIDQEILAKLKGLDYPVP